MFSSLHWLGSVDVSFTQSAFFLIINSRICVVSVFLHCESHVWIMFLLAVLIAVLHVFSILCFQLWLKCGSIMGQSLQWTTINQSYLGTICFYDNKIYLCMTDGTTKRNTDQTRHTTHTRCLSLLPCSLLSRPILSCSILSCSVWSGPVLSCLALCCPVLPCPV